MCGSRPIAGAITSGTFEGLWLGDIGSTTTWLGVLLISTRNALSSPHIVVMPDRPLYRHRCTIRQPVDQLRSGDLRSGRTLTAVMTM